VILPVVDGVDTSSFELENELSAKDRTEILRIMHNDVLETDKYPEIHYESSSVNARAVGEGRFWVVLDGTLSLHGVTCPHKIVASLVVNGDTCRASGDFSIRQLDYNIKLVSVAGGKLKVKDEVKCTFDIVARKAE
jgi:polyisoprenoid-binding protein YceI